jgi:hypothetical protein
MATRLGWRSSAAVLLGGVFLFAACGSPPRAVYVADAPPGAAESAQRMDCRTVAASIDLSEVFQPYHTGGEADFVLHPRPRRSTAEPVEFCVGELSLVVADSVVPAQGRRVTWKTEHDGSRQIASRSDWTSAVGACVPATYEAEDGSIEPLQFSYVFRFEHVPHAVAEVATLRGRLLVRVGDAVAETLIVAEPLRKIIYE